MVVCNLYDVGCNLQNFAQWVYSFFAPYLDPLWGLFDALIVLFVSIITLIINFAISLFMLGYNIATYVLGFYLVIFTDPYALAIVVLLQMYVSIVIFLRVWNIIADTQIFGIKLPKIPV